MIIQDTSLLLKACQVKDVQLMTFRQLTKGLFPAIDAQYGQLCIQIRRIGHIIEHSPNNIAGQLRAGGAPARAFVAVGATGAYDGRGP